MGQPLQALIIGAGSIGGLIDSPSSQGVASHAHAYTLSAETELCAICEPSELNAFAFMERWGDVEFYPSITQLPVDKQIDIVSVSSITASHFYDMTSLLKRQDCRYILCEKPLVSTKEELSALSPLLIHTNKKILVNLIRRYNRTFIAVAKRIGENEFGKTLGFQGVCTKGLLHNGSHMLGVLSHFLGKPSTIKPFGAAHCNGDLCGEFGLSFSETDGVVSVLHHPQYSLFELTLWFENGAIKILEGGERIEIYSRIPSSVYQGYFTLELRETLMSDLSRYALDSLEFLLHESTETCKSILKEHLHIHELIFQTFSKVY